MFFKGILASLGLALSAQWTLADCYGENLFDKLPKAQQEAIQTRSAQTPFGSGNFWRATKGDQSLILLGTYHIRDDRHYDLMEKIQPYWADTKGLLVEATAQEERDLQNAIALKPELAFITQGPSLMQQLPRQDWERLSQALQDRGVPSFMAAKYKPWFAALTLGIAPCAMDAAADGGLDDLLLVEASAKDLPITALEPYDTIFNLFNGFSHDQLIEMVQTTLALEDQSSDLAVTLADLYFRGDSRMIWEFNREFTLLQPDLDPDQVAAEMEAMEETLMKARNRAWIPVITQAAAKGPHIVAFGALHLSGEQGVLNLLKLDGWQVDALF